MFPDCIRPILPGWNGGHYWWSCKEAQHSDVQLSLSVWGVLSYIATYEPNLT